MKNYIFYLEFGKERLTEEVALDDSTPAWGVQRVYERWRDDHLVCGWWDKKSDHAAFRLMQRLRREKEEATNG